MRYKLMSVGEYTFYDEPYYRGLIGGRIIATNPETGEKKSKFYKKFHTGKTDKFNVLEQLMLEMVPPTPSQQGEE